MTQVFINLSTLELDGNYLEQVKSRLESYKASLETDHNFAWLGSQEETLEEAKAILQNIEDWATAKKMIDSRIEDNEDHINDLKLLISSIPDLLANPLAFASDDDEEEDSFVITTEQLKRLATLGEISYISGTVTRENGRTEPLFLNANDKIRPPMNTLRDGDTFEIDDINLDIAGSEMETEAVKKLVEKLFNH